MRIISKKLSFKDKDRWVIDYYLNDGENVGFQTLEVHNDQKFPINYKGVTIDLAEQNKLIIAVEKTLMGMISLDGGTADWGLDKDKARKLWEALDAFGFSSIVVEK